VPRNAGLNAEILSGFFRAASPRSSIQTAFVIVGWLDDEISCLAQSERCSPRSGHTSPLPNRRSPRFGGISSPLDGNSVESDGCSPPINRRSVRVAGNSPPFDRVSPPANAVSPRAGRDSVLMERGSPSPGRYSPSSKPDSPGKIAVRLVQNAAPGRWRGAPGENFQARPAQIRSRPG